MLLFADLRRHTPVNHADRAAVEQAHSIAVSMVANINTGMKREDSLQRLSVLQATLVGLGFPLVEPGRYFVRAGALQKASRTHNGRSYERWLLLVSDLLIVAQRDPITGKQRVKGTHDAPAGMAHRAPQ